MTLEDAHGRPARGDLPRNREPDDASSNDRNIDFSHANRKP